MDDIGNIPMALTFDDVLLVPGASSVVPNQANLSTTLTKKTKHYDAIKLHTPLISAAMDTVTDTTMAIALAHNGGIGIIHKNMPIKTQAEKVGLVKKFESCVVKNPVTISEDTTIAEAIAKTKKLGFSSIPVVKNNRLSGLITNRDIRFAEDISQPVKNVMTPFDKLITVKPGASVMTACKLMHQHRIEKVLVTDTNNQLVGMMTARDIINATEQPYSTKDRHGRLRVGAAIGVGKESQDRAYALVEAGCDVIVIDTAHGHSRGVIEQIKWFKKNLPKTPIIAGNIVTPEAAKDLVAAGCDAIKVGIGPGSICTTRVIAGVGMPQITAINSIAKALSGTDTPIIADGGIRYSGDITKAIAAGAWSIMIGGLFAGCEESPGDVELYQGRAYKVYRGMGSIKSMKKGSSDRYFQENNKKLVPEGVEGRVPFKGSVNEVIHQLTGGLRSGMGYTGCKDLDSLRKYNNLVRVSTSGVTEGHVHDITITKEAPNYSK